MQVQIFLYINNKDSKFILIMYSLAGSFNNFNDLNFVLKFASQDQLIRFK